MCGDQQEEEEEEERNQPSSVPERETSGLPTSCHLRQASPTFDRILGNPRNTLLAYMIRCQMAFTDLKALNLSRSIQLRLKSEDLE